MELVQGRRIKTVRYSMPTIIPAVENQRRMRDIVNRVNIILRKGQWFLEFTMRRNVSEGRGFLLDNNLVRNCTTLFFGAHPLSGNTTAIHVKDHYLPAWQHLCCNNDADMWGTVEGSDGNLWQSIEYATNAYYDTLLENFDSKATWGSHMAIFFVGMGLARTMAEGRRIAHQIIKYAEKEIYADRPRLFSAPDDVDRNALPEWADEWVAQTSFLLNEESHRDPRDGAVAFTKQAKARQHTQFFRERLRMLSMLDLESAETRMRRRRFDALPRYSMSCGFVRIGEATLYAMIEGKRLSGRTCSNFSREETAKYSMQNSDIFKLPSASGILCSPRTFMTDGCQVQIGWETNCTWIERERKKRSRKRMRPEETERK